MTAADRTLGEIKPMPPAEPALLLREIRKLVQASDCDQGVSDVPDQLLLRRFIDHRDESAFGLLLARHGAMVLGVCRALLRHEQDAEDVFQATFLVLARKADTIRTHESVGSWLHGVAHNLARNVQTSSYRRRSRSGWTDSAGNIRETALETADPVLDLTVRELHRALSEELCKLPEKYRAALVLCHLEGRSQDEAAAQLGCTRGSLRGRLNRGREQLRARLARRGMNLSTVFPAVLPGGLPCLPASLAEATVRAALMYSAGEKVAGVVVSAQAAALAEGALKVVPAARLVLAAILFLGLSLLAAAAVGPARRPSDPPQAALAPDSDPEPVDFDPAAVAVGSLTREVWSVAVSHDGKSVLSVAGQFGRIGEVVVWDVATGKPRVRVRQHGARAVAFHPNGRSFAVANFRETVVRVFDAGSGRLLRTLHGHTGGSNGVTYAPDGHTLATCGHDGTVRLWDPDTGRLRLTLRGHTADGVYTVAISLDSKWLASCGADKTARIYELETGKAKSVLAGHREAVESVAFAPDGTVATGSWDRTIKLWDPATGKEKATLEGHKLPILSVAFSPDGKRLASGSGKWAHNELPDGPGELKLWDVATGKTTFDLSGHADRVWSVAFSPNGKTLVSGSWDKSVRLWDVKTGKQQRSMSLKEGKRFEPAAVLTAAYAARTDLLALAPEDGTVALVDAASGELLHTIKSQQDAVVSLAFSPDGRTLATGGTDNSVRLWETGSAKSLKTLEGHAGWVYGLAFAHDGKTLASASFDKTIRLWDIANGKHLRTLNGHKASVRAVSFRPDGKALASASTDHRVLIWDLVGKAPPLTLKGHTDFVRTVCYSPDGKLLASAGEDGAVRLWDSTTGAERFALEPWTKAQKLPRVEVTALMFAPRGGWLVAGGQDGLVRLWDPVAGVSKGILRGQAAVIGVGFSLDGRLIAADVEGRTRAWSTVVMRKRAARTSFPGTGEAGWAVAFSPDGGVLAAVRGGESGTLELKDVSTGARRALVKEGKMLRCVEFSPDGKLLATGCFDNSVQLRDPTTGATHAILKGHTRGVNSLAFSADGKRLLTGGLDRTVRLWDVKTLKELAVLTGHTDDVFSVAFSPDGKSAASAGRDRTIKVWDLETRKEKLTLKGHTQPVEQVVFSPHGKALASAGWDHSVRIWDVSSGETLRMLRGQESACLALAFSSDGKRLAVANGNLVDEIAGEIRLWDLGTGDSSHCLTGHARGVRDVRFSPDGRSLATMGEDGVVKLWDVPGGPR